MSDIVNDLNLIYDRTEEDVLEGTEKGFYNCTDMNRVGRAVQTIADRLDSVGINTKVAPVTNWNYESLPTVSDFQYYLNQVQILRDAFVTYGTTPDLPENMNRLNYTKANDIEKILADINELYLKMIEIWYYSGELYGGEV